MSLKKILLSLSLALLIIVVFLSGFILYLYYNPDKIKPMVERSLSSYTGSSCAIENLSYSLKPLTLKVENISLTSHQQETNFLINLRLLQADMNLAGSFGLKTLVLNNVKIKGLSVGLLSENLALPGIASREKGSPSLIGKAVGSLVSLLLFKDI
ncbi:MAG: hypothetical protein JRD68_16500, partial [Deltaproteobacteria bacterium]|nr:hypothetical protein [Deltaproteobacteria bacterium]